MKGFESLATLPAWGIAVLGVLIVVQLALDVWAFMDLYRRPVDQLTISNKWIWVVIILFVSTLGAILYLLVGRKPAPVAEVAPQRPAADRGANAADALYGPPKGIGPR
jgi:uncharacterized membrane protein YcfT